VNALSARAFRPRLAPYRNDLLRILITRIVPTIYLLWRSFLFASTAAISETPLGVGS